MLDPSFETDGHGLDLRQYFTILRRRWAWWLIPFVLLVALAVQYSSQQEQRFEAAARVLLADTEAQQALDPGSQNAVFLNRGLSNEVSLARGDTALSHLIEELGEIPNVRITADSSADILIFTGSAPTPELSARYANAWADAYVRLKQDEAAESLVVALTNLRGRLVQLRQERAVVRAPLKSISFRQARETLPEAIEEWQRAFDRKQEELSYELSLIDSQAAAVAASVANLELRAELSAVGTARIIQVAAPPTLPASPPASRTIALGVVAGAIVGVGLAIVRENLDQSIRTPYDVRLATDLPVLAAVPRPRGRSRRKELALSVRTDPEGPAADAYQRVRAALEFAGLGNEVKSVLVTSPNQSEGKTTTSSNLAWALALVGTRTLLIDVDFRRPRVHRVYGLANSPGLTDNIIHGIPFGKLVSRAEPEVAELLVAPVGAIPPNPAGFVGSKPFVDAIEWLEAEADVLVLDAPPILPVSDALTIGSRVDAVVLTVMARRTTRTDLKATLEALEHVGANVLGVVMTSVRRRDGHSRYTYGSKPRSTVLKAEVVG